MYTDYYHLDDDPFRMSPAGFRGFVHASYRSARSYITYALNRGEGIVLITGVPGTGKTTLINEIINKTRDTQLQVTRLTCQQFDADSFLRQYLFALGLTPARDDRSAMLEALERHLRQTNADRNWPVLILDEAQGLDVEALEQVRLLTNYQVDDQPLLQVFLFGQSELRDRILSPQLEQLHQRLVASCTLERLSLEETRDYVVFRLKRAGWNGAPELATGVVNVMFDASQGIPRWINLVGSRLLLFGAVEQREHISAADAEQVVADLLSESLLPSQVRADRRVSSGTELPSSNGALEA